MNCPNRSSNRACVLRCLRGFADSTHRSPVAQDLVRHSSPPNELDAGGREVGRSTTCRGQWAWRSRDRAERVTDGIAAKCAFPLGLCGKKASAGSGA
jgi:hypothetical protein